MDDDPRSDLTGQLLEDYVRRVSEQVVTPPFTGRPERGRRRRRGREGRRVLAVVLATMTVAGVVAVLVAYGPRSSDRGSGVTGHRGGTVPTAGARGRSVTFPGPFRPDEEVGAGGALWLMGPSGPQVGQARCDVARLDPVTLSRVTFPIAACGINTVAHSGTLYLEDENEAFGTNNVTISIETVSMATHVSTVLTPVDITVVGSERAHTQLAYADGWLWLYGYTTSPEVVQVSPTSGAVIHVFTSGVPEIGGTEPLISAGPGGVWLAGGAGGSSALALLSLPSFGLEWILSPVPLQPPPSDNASATVEWMSAVDGLMWVGEATFGADPGAVSERIVAVSSTGTVVKESPVEDIGSALVAINGAVYAVSPGPQCGNQFMWKVDPSSLRTTIVSTVHLPFNPCVSEGYRSFTSAGGAVFVLEAPGGSVESVLYRIAP
jgi:hypothetical protein